jgi:RNA polymerase sigma factor (sigma-70 family)
LSPAIKYSEEELIQQIRQKDQKAFSYLYDNYSRALFGAVHAIVNDKEESEDILQKTFLKIWNGFSSYDPEKGRLYTWMLNIARNLAIDSTRSKQGKMRSKIQSTDENVYKFENCLRATDQSHDTIGLKSILEKLKDDHKQIIDLAYFEGYTQEEMAIQLQIPIGTIKTRVRQALLKLRELTKKEITT